MGPFLKNWLLFNAVHFHYHPTMHLASIVSMVPKGQVGPADFRDRSRTFENYEKYYSINICHKRFE